MSCGRGAIRTQQQAGSWPCRLTDLHLAPARNAGQGPADTAQQQGFGSARCSPTQTRRQSLANWRHPTLAPRNRRGAAGSCPERTRDVSVHQTLRAYRWSHGRAERGVESLRLVGAGTLLTLRCYTQQPQNLLMLCARVPDGSTWPKYQASVRSTGHSAAMMTMAVAMPLCPSCSVEKLSPCPVCVQPPRCLVLSDVHLPSNHGVAHVHI